MSTINWEKIMGKQVAEVIKKCEGIVEHGIGRLTTPEIKTILAYIKQLEKEGEEE